MGRRGHGEGSISQRRDGRWEGRIDLGWKAGKRVRKMVYGATRAEVARKVNALVRDRELGLVRSGPSQRVGAFLEEWLGSVRGSLRPSTFRTYELYVRRHIVAELGRVRLDQLKAEDVQRMLDRKLATGMSPQTVVHLRAILRRALNRAMRYGYLARNVAALAEPPKVERREMHVLDPDQARAFLKAANADPFRALYTLALFTGLRQGELLGLRWTDVDLEEAQLRMSHSLQRHGGKLRLVAPKTATSRRSVSIPTVAVIALREHRVHQLQARLLAGASWQETGLIFTTGRGTGIEAGNVVRSFKRTLRRAELPEMRFHDLRHSCATLLLVQGVAPRVVMEILGHSQISLTMNTYSHVVPALQREAAAKLDALLEPRRGEEGDEVGKQGRGRG
jgi:integrase